MIKIILSICLVAVIALAAPEDPVKRTNSDGEATILKYNNDNIGVEGYNFDFETSNGITRSETGELSNVDSENATMTVRGQYSWLDDQGRTHTIEFVANQDGYRPKYTIT